MPFAKPALVAALCLASTALCAPALAQSANSKIAQKQAEIPTCTHKIGVLAVREPANKWWQGLGLESPEALIKVFVQKSQCFTLVDRGAGFEMAQQERALAAGGQLQQGANIGGGQVLAADYILVPDIVSKNANSGGTNIGGMFGGLVGGFAGAIISGISIKSSTADVVLTVTNVRTSAQEAMEEGHGSKTDVGFGIGGGGFGLGRVRCGRHFQLSEHRNRPGGDAGLHRRLFQAGERLGRAFGHRQNRCAIPDRHPVTPRRAAQRGE